MSLISDLITNAMGGTPQKPQVPTFPTITAGAAQSNALASNLAALPQLEKLASGTDLFNQEQIQKMLESFIPGYHGISSKASSNISDLLAGKVPTDVGAAVTESDAAKALSGGYSGSGMHGSLVARDLGLTSLDLTQKGLGEAAGWISMMDRIAAPGQLNVTSMFVTPSQELAQENLNASEQFNVQWLKNQLAALPDPGTAMIARDVGDLTGGLAPSAMGGTPGGFTDSVLSRGSSMGGGGGGMGGWGSMMGGSAGGLDTGASVDYGGEMATAGSTGGAAAAGGGL